MFFAATKNAADSETGAHHDPGPPLFDDIPFTADGPIFRTKHGSYHSGHTKPDLPPQSWMVSTEQNSMQNDGCDEDKVIDEQFCANDHCRIKWNTLAANNGTTITDGDLSSSQDSSCFKITQKSHDAIVTGYVNLHRSMTRTCKRGWHFPHVSRPVARSLLYNFDDDEQLDLELQASEESAFCQSIQRCPWPGLGTRVVPASVSGIALIGSAAYFFADLYDQRISLVLLVIAVGVPALAWWHVTRTRSIRGLPLLLPYKRRAQKSSTNEA